MKDIQPKMIWAQHAVRMEEIRNAYRILLGKPGKKRKVERPRFTTSCCGGGSGSSSSSSYCCLSMYVS
jgi:hypothetical protein